MCDLGDEQTRIVLALYEALGVSGELLNYGRYALLVLATGTPIDRATTYLKDTGTPENASGRLLLRAAERALREAGDID